MPKKQDSSETYLLGFSPLGVVHSTCTAWTCKKNLRNPMCTFSLSYQYHINIITANKSFVNIYLLANILIFNFKNNNKSFRINIPLLYRLIGIYFRYSFTLQEYLSNNSLEYFFSFFESLTSFQRIEATFNLFEYSKLDLSEQKSFKN